MSTNPTTPRRSFKQLERTLSYVVFADLVLFILMMVFSCQAILWLKIVLGILVMVLSGLGCCFLVLIEEHKKSRSWWILSAFGSLLLCALVSMITGSPV